MSGGDGRGAARLAESETRFRQVNEAIERGHPPQRGRAAFLCECGRLGCTEVVELEARQYEAVRTSFTRFLVVPGHVTPIDRVVEDHGGYLVVEKVGETPRRIAREDDRRTAGDG